MINWYCICGKVGLCYLPGSHNGGGTSKSEIAFFSELCIIIISTSSSFEPAMHIAANLLLSMQRGYRIVR